MKKRIIVSISLILAIVMCVAVLCACAPNSDPNKAVSALSDKGYTAGQDNTIIPSALRLFGVKDIDCVVSGTKKVGDDIESVTIVYFSSKSAADNNWAKMQEYVDDQEEKDDSDYEIKKSGKMIYWGTDQGIKDAR